MTTITEDYVSYEVAKLLKEKGFLKGIDLHLIPNLAFYDNIGLQYNVAKWYDSLIQDKINFVVAPTHQMACKWLREVHSLFIMVDCGVGAYVWNVADMSNGNVILKVDSVVGSYEQAVETAIKYCLESLI